MICKRCKEQEGVYCSRCMAEVLEGRFTQQEKNSLAKLVEWEIGRLSRKKAQMGEEALKTRQGMELMYRIYYLENLLEKLRSGGRRL